jgi:hypothetical protein
MPVLNLKVIGMNFRAEIPRERNRGYLKYAMNSAPRHECLIYNGAPSRHLPALATAAKTKLAEGYRCLYLNSPVMVAGMRSYLAASGLDVAYEVARASLVLSSDQSHLTARRFEVARMMAKLEDAVNQALEDGFRGLWATGDMGWEFGPEADFSKLVEYEWKLEEFFRRQPAISGICQYHCDTLPKTAVRQGVLMHPSIFLNATLSRLNPNYLRDASFESVIKDNPGLESAVTQLCRMHDSAN